MAASTAPYEAIRIIMFGDVRAYNPGDIVPASAVDGPDAWLVLDEDVKVRDGFRPDKPARNANQALWAAYAVSRGAKVADVMDMSRVDLIKAYG